MTIKEIEELAEMPRANIRYYEEQGLLNPTRGANGYRDYSEEDLSILKKVKLLRSLHMSLDEIKAVHKGQQNLSVVLERQLQILSAEKEETNKAQSVCETMYRDGTRYENLDAEKYLSALKESQSFKETRYWSSNESKTDRIPRVQAPWRRYFARALDWAVYSLIWDCILMFGFHINIANLGLGLQLLGFVVEMVLLMVLEPLQLSLFGTTLGKWILGLHVLHNDDRKLSFIEAFERTGIVLCYGYGLCIPILSLITLWKSCKICINGQELAWAYDSRLILKDQKNFCVVSYVAARAALLGVAVLTSVLAMSPVNRGELTVAEFCENYRILAKFFDLESGYTLDDNGNWVDSTPNNGEVIFLSLNIHDHPKFIFETDSEGNIQKISFKIEDYISAETPQDRRKEVPNCQNQMQLAVLAFVVAQEDFPLFSSTRDDMLEIIGRHIFSDYTFKESGVTVNCEVEWEGYRQSYSTLISTEGEESSVYMEFSMTLED